MVLDAVRDCVLAVGVRRTTLTDVARRAGVSRMTLYRKLAKYRLQEKPASVSSPSTMERLPV